MTVQEKRCGTIPMDKIIIDVDTPAGLKEQSNAGDDFAPKVRKPYTITKHREKWTEEDHERFLEALKLYGRTWRRIEEHVGTKTAVQIRSHAQKFFSKIERDSNCCDPDSAKPIEIPLPRQKRKPLHPYPRKLVCPVKTGIAVPKKPTRSTSSNLSSLKHENHSPTSVLSAVGSDLSARGNPGLLRSISSSVLSALAINSCSSSPDRKVSLELELLSQNNSLLKEEDSVSKPNAQCLKLFGRTLLVPDQSSSPALESKSLELLEECEGRTFPSSILHLKSLPNNSETVCCAEVSSSDAYHMGTSFRIHLPWLTLYGNDSHSNHEVHNPIPIRTQPLCEMDQEILEKDEEKEGSSCTSSIGFVYATRGDGRCRDRDSNNLPSTKTKSEVKESSTVNGLSENSGNHPKGFLPYKRCSGEREHAEMADDASNSRFGTAYKLVKISSR